MCEEGAFTEAELAAYDRYWDAIRVENTLISVSRKEGREEGRAEGREEREKLAEELEKEREERAALLAEIARLKQNGA
jgi:hypothetical protein